MNLREKMELLRQSHYVCDDCWYSCPKSGQCCNDTSPHDYCNCGADRHNAIIDEILLANP
jgi:hypothetical protein